VIRDFCAAHTSVQFCVIGLIQIGLRPALNSPFSGKFTSNDSQRWMAKEPFAVFEIWTHAVQILARIALNHIANLYGLIIIIGWLRLLWVETPMTNCLAALEG